MWGQLYLNEQLEIASGPLLKTKQLGNLTWKHPICTKSKLKSNEGIKFFCLWTCYQYFLGNFKIWIHPRENSTQLREQCQTTSDCKSNFYDHYMHVLIHNLSVKLAIMKCRILIGINGALHHVYCTRGSWMNDSQLQVTM